MPSNTQRAGSPAGGLLLFIRLCVALALAMISVPLLVASSASADPDPNDTIVVCKYVGTPGESELLQTGQNPITPNLSTMGQDFDGVFPALWPTDAQLQSLAIGLLADVEPVLSSCPGFEPPPEVCPEGTDNAGQEIPEGETIESFCNEEEPPAVCPEGTDNAGEEIPEGETVESFCNEEEPPAVCPEGTDNAGDVIPEGETVETFCNEEDNPPEPILPPSPPNPPAPPAPPAPPEPVLPNTGSSAYLAGLALMGGLMLTAGSALFMRSRKVRVPKA